MIEYKPPFPYFGGKSTVARAVWERFGDVDNYIEPFFGSGAALFLRPTTPRTETVNDADGLLANFWRAVKSDPVRVAEFADWPVNEADLHARGLWLCGERERITERLMGDPDFFDARAAGWWAWGLCSSIGGGWCSGRGPWRSVDGVFTRVDDGNGDGVSRKKPHLNQLRGVNRRPPAAESHFDHLVSYMRRLAQRLRYVFVCCGDWSRVVTGFTTTTGKGLTGVFLDPPYSLEAGRDHGCYAVDCLSVAHKAREWAIEAGRDPMMRVALCGYKGEHVMPDDWEMFEWRTRGGMANQSDGRGRINARRERIWFSPHCLKEKLLWNTL